MASPKAATPYNGLFKGLHKDAICVPRIILELDAVHFRGVQYKRPCPFQDWQIDFTHVPKNYWYLWTLFG